jgi:hypothetical protein
MGLVLADTRGDVAAMEKTYDRQGVRPAAEGMTFCTNHFVEPEMAGTVPPAHEGLIPNSETRYNTLKTLFAQGVWPHTLDVVKRALAYHGDAGLHSNYSCIAVPRLRQLWLGDGYPCEDRYTIYQL